MNTGEVAVCSIHKDDPHTDYVLVGHSTNLASRMKNLAILSIEGERGQFQMSRSNCQYCLP